MLGASEHNLKNIDVEIPARAADRASPASAVRARARSCTTSSTRRSRRPKGDWDRPVGAHRKLEGAEFVTDVVLVDQNPIGRTPRSNPVTYLKAFDPIRELFAADQGRALARADGQPLLVQRARRPLRGVRRGRARSRSRCSFSPTSSCPCDQCEGKRFKPQVLEVKYRGRGIDQVLDMTVREALTFFSSSPKVLRRLQVLDEIGLGYLRLGQPATTLSGGEAQRIKIAAHLSSHTGDRILYILDEPTTGLHFDDIAKLLAAFRKLLQAGHSLLVIEHNLDVIKTADWIVDLGPEGGEEGGRLIAAGTPGADRQGRGVAHRPLPAGRRSRSAARTRTAAGADTRLGVPAECQPEVRRLPACRDPAVRLAAEACMAHPSVLRGRSFAVCLPCLRPASRSRPRFDDVVRNLRNPDPKVRLSAVRLLRESKYPEAVAPIAALVNDPVDQIQLEAIAAELSFFLVEDVPAKKRVGLLVEVRKPGQARGGVRAGAARGRGRAPVPPELVDACSRRSTTRTPKVRTSRRSTRSARSRGRRCADGRRRS